jgi:two-component system response regulator
METVLNTLLSPILIVDDDKDDQFFLKQAINDVLPAALVESLYDGAEAIDYLIKCLVPPDLIFLDLNMCRISGRETLNYIKKHVRFKKIPVIILTTSKSDIEKKELIQMGASEFYSKPGQLTDLVNIVKEVQKKWLSVLDRRT